MDVQKILTSGLINTAELARRIWPDIDAASAKVRMHQKLSDKVANRKLTAKDLQLIEKELENILK